MRQGTILRVPTLVAEPGSRVEISEVLLLSDGDTVTVGSPTVSGAMVVAEVLEHGKGAKVINFKFKAKTRYRRKRGHRQGYTALKVSEILTGGATPKVAETSSSRRAASEASEPTTEVTPAPRRRARAAAAPAPDVDAAPAAPAAPARRRRAPAKKAEE